MRLVLALAAIAAVSFGQQTYSSDPNSSNSKPTLLLTDQRMKRLKRDRTRQTERWTNFEARVKSTPASPERGFELALYARITGDAASSIEASNWAKAHPCERRQVALINSLGSGSQTPAVPPSGCAAKTGLLAAMRDSVFEHASAGGLPFDGALFLKLLKGTRLTDAAELYAATEILLAVSRDVKAEVREQDPQFFNTLPVQFLLSLKPQQVEHPDWMTHVAALGLIALDPNSDSSQFLQGWAIEDRQMLHDGPGIAYELLWADPYLPGVGYQNLDPWFYDASASRLLARSGWSADACSINISTAGVDSTQCPPGWQSQKTVFGHLQLVAMMGQCIEMPARSNTDSAIIWKLAPKARLKATEGSKSVPQQADQAGLWRVPFNIVGKVCSVR